MTVILLDIAVVTKDYPGCLPKLSRVSIWSLRRAQTEFVRPAVPGLLLVAFQSLRSLEQRQRVVVAGCLPRLPREPGERFACRRVLLGWALRGFMLFFPF